MTVHLVRMAVGVESLAHLARRQAARRSGSDSGGTDGQFRLRTRNTPKRAAEILDGGSLYWIIKGHIRARQRIVGIDRVTDETGRNACLLTVDPEIVPTDPLPRKAQQGWRYLTPEDAPADRGAPGDESEPDGLPPDLAAELRELGLL